MKTETPGEMVRVMRGLVDAVQTVAKKVERMEETLAHHSSLLEGFAKKSAPKKSNAGRLVMGRMAARAGMSLDQWQAHCLKTGHNPLRMDRSIENFSRGSLSVKPSPAREKFLAENRRTKAPTDD